MSAVRHAAAAVAVIGLLCLAGCMEVTTQVSESGAAVSVMKVVIPADEPDKVPQIRQHFHEYLRDEYPDWSLSERTRDEQIEFTCRRVYGNNDTLPSPRAAEKPKQRGVQVEIEQRGLAWEYRFTDLSPWPVLPAWVGEMVEVKKPVTYTVTMPGRITEASTDLIEGNTATWEFTLADRSTEISTSARVSQWPRLLIVLVCAAALVAGYFFVAKAA